MKYESRLTEERQWNSIKSRKSQSLLLIKRLRITTNFHILNSTPIEKRFISWPPGQIISRENVIEDWSDD